MVWTSGVISAGGRRVVVIAVQSRAYRAVIRTGRGGADSGRGLA